MAESQGAPAMFNELHATSSAATETRHAPTASGSERQVKLDTVIFEAVIEAAKEAAQQPETVVGWIASWSSKPALQAVALRDGAGRIVTVTLAKERASFVLGLAERYGRMARPLSSGIKVIGLALDFSDELIFNGIKAICSYVGENRQGIPTSGLANTNRGLREAIEAQDAPFRPAGP